MSMKTFGSTLVLFVNFGVQSCTTTKVYCEVEKKDTAITSTEYKWKKKNQKNVLKKYKDVQLLTYAS